MLCPFCDKAPVLAPTACVADNATLMGQVTVGPEANIWYGAVLRGDEAPITVGEGSNLQDNAVVHVSPGHPTHIGRWVTVGHGAILHGCTVEDGSLVGMGAILMNDCVIGTGAMVAAGALVTQRTVIPPHSLVMGSPAKVVRSLTEAEVAGQIEIAQEYAQRAQLAFPPADTGSAT